MTDQEAFEAWLESVKDRIDITQGSIWHAALAWLRSQGEPVAFIGERDGMLWREQADAGDTPLFLAPRAIENDDREYLSAIAHLGRAMKRLVIAARTSGGTAGPDTELMAACAQAEDAMSVGAIGRAMEAPQPAIPDGWRLVPLTATDEMELRGAEATHGIEWSDAPGDAPYDLAVEVYNAMLAAAPEYNQGEVK